MANIFSNLSDFRNINIELTKVDLRNSVKDDIIIIQVLHCLEELEVIINKLVKVLREWYELYNPELSKSIHAHEGFVELVLSKSKASFLKEIGLSSQDSIGADLDEQSLTPINALASQIKSLFHLRKSQEAYMERVMKKLCPNLAEVAGAVIGARLIAHAGSLKHLSEVPASTVQIYGAEKALFRHMKTRAKMPRHGLIANHPLIAQAPQNMHGKIARALADKISIAARIDYFKGKFLGDKLKKTLIDKFKINY